MIILSISKFYFQISPIINSNLLNALPKFTGKHEDYPAWDKKFRSTVLLACDFTKLLKIKNADEVDTEDKQRAIDLQYQEKNEKLYAVLNLTMTDSLNMDIEVHCQGETDGVKAWIFIQNKYSKTTLLQLLTWKKQLSNIRLAEDGDLNAYIKEIRTLMYQITRATKKDLDMDELVTTILVGLPKKYEPWIMMNIEKKDAVKLLKELEKTNNFIQAKNETLVVQSYLHWVPVRVEPNPIK